MELLDLTSVTCDECHCLVPACETAFQRRMTTTFDTLKFTKRLKEAGFSEAQAEAVTDSFPQATGEAEVATKRDLERIEAKIERLETKLTGELTLVKWMLGILIRRCRCLTHASVFSIIIG